VTGSGIGAPWEPKEGLTVYDGVQFPLYCGYATFHPDGTVKFTKKTDLPITRIVEFFDKVEQGSVYIPPYSPYTRVGPDGGFVREITTDDKLFQEIVEHEMVWNYKLYSAKRDLYDDPPDENFSPRFKETCIFNSQSTPPEFCFKVSFDTIDKDKGK
jgi:hypothetical protein